MEVSLFEHFCFREFFYLCIMLFDVAGRINLTDLASILNVDLTHIKNQIPSLLGLNAGISEVLGQLIDNTYKKRLAEEINVKLEELGQLSIGDLAHTYDLPPDFLKQVSHLTHEPNVS